MLRIAMLLIVAAISTAQVRSAPAPGETRTSLGPLDFSCSKWTNVPKRSTDHEILKGWALGFISGMNWENADGDFLQGRDVDGVTAWIDNYCGRNPLHATTQAIYELIQVLKAGAPLTPLPVPPPRPR
jgi:hypothetical protein